jgi:hypothetical protein
MKMILAGIGLTIACNAQASLNCKVNLINDLSISNESIRVVGEGRPVYEINRNQQLWVDGKAVVLDGEQAALLGQYETKMRALVPEVKNMAVAGINTALVALSVTLDEILGEDNSISEQLDAELNGLKSDVQHYFSSGNTIHFSAGNEGSPDLFGNYFATRVERIIETSAYKLPGEVLLAMGRELLSSKGSIETFERRMERFGDLMERQMESKAEALESQGVALCRSIVELERVEENLRKALGPKMQFDLLQVKMESSTHSI